MVYQFFVNKIGSGVNVNEVLAQELNKPEIKKFKGRKVYAKFKDNIWATDLEMGSLCSKNPVVKYLLCVIDVFAKSACVRHLNEKKLKQFLIVLLK